MASRYSGVVTAPPISQDEYLLLKWELSLSVVSNLELLISTFPTVM